MATVRVVYKPGAFAAVRTAPGVLSELTARAERIAGAAGPGYEARAARSTGGRVRGRASVGTATFQAMRDNARNHTLLRALGSGRG